METAQQANNSQSELSEPWQTLHRAYDLVWSMKFSEAEALLLPLIDGAEVQPWYLSAYAEIQFYRYTFNETADNETALNARLALLEQRANEMHAASQLEGGFFSNFFSRAGPAKDPAQFVTYLQSLVLLGYVNLCYGMVEFRKQSIVKGGYYLRKSWKYFEEAEQLDRQARQESIAVHEQIRGLIDFGFGVFHFAISLVPRTVQWLVSLLGFEGQRPLSLTLLRRAADSRCLKHIEARVVLIAQQWYFDDQQDEAQTALDALLAENDSSLLNYLSGFIARSRGDLQRAVTCFAKVFTAPAEFKQLQLIGKYHLGYTYFLLQDHVHSAEYLQQFIDQDVSVSGKRFRPYAAFMLGFDYWMLDMRDKVPPLYAQIKAWVRDNQSFDKYALRRAENFLKSGKFTKFEELFIGAAALHEGKNYSASLKTIEQVIPLLKEEPNNRDQYALFYWLKGSCLRGLKKADRATSMFEHAIGQEQLAVHERHAMPYSWVELGEMALEAGDLNKAEECLNKAKSYKKYDWETLLSYRITGNLQKISKKRADSKQ